MRQGEINGLKEKAVHAALEVSCEDVFRSFGSPIMKRGTQIYIRCPSCGAEPNERKCSINANKNLWHCFGCNTGGGAAQAYSMLVGVKWIEAAIQLGYQSGAITADEYDTLTGTANHNKLISDSQAYKKFDSVESICACVKAPPERTDLVYRHLLSLPEFALNDEGMRHLVNSRGLSGKEIREEGYFSYTKRFSIESLVKSIQKEQSSFNYGDLIGVPGFYFKPKDEKYGWWKFKPPYEHCLGIPLKDSAGRIVALQMRNLSPKCKDNKYFYVTSAGIKGCDHGCSPGTPVHVIYPEGKLRSACIYVGEGAFKMREIAKEGVVACSIQGINSFHYVADEVRDIMTSKVVAEKSSGLADRRMSFCICFDADMYRKIEVVTAAEKFAGYLKKNFPGRTVRFILWNPDLGKGYDDMKAFCNKNGVDYHSAIRCVDSDWFIPLIKKSIAEADKGFEKKRDNAQRRCDEWKNKFYHVLYEENVSKLF